jgi:hypothetical protein
MTPYSIPEPIFVPVSLPFFPLVLSLSVDFDDEHPGLNLTVITIPTRADVASAKFRRHRYTNTAEKANAGYKGKKKRERRREIREHASERDKKLWIILFTRRPGEGRGGLDGLVQSRPGSKACRR